MSTTNQQRHQMIERALRRQSDAQTDVNVALWVSLAAELRGLIGDRGFEALYLRSLYITSAAFPWMTPPTQHASGNVFELVDFSLDMRDADGVHLANAALLNAFTDTLIVLIGEPLTSNILRRAWGDEIVNNAGTEHQP